MERLTERVGENGRTVIYVGEHKQYEDGDIPCEISDAAKREVLKRLAAYEDTGLEPEEVAAAMKDGTYAQFQEWNRAHYEGRLVVLPCKVGDTVWEIGYDCKIDYEDMCAFPAPSCDECEFVKRVIVPVRVDSVTVATFLIGKIGTTAFFSFEEAEAALKGVNEDA